MSRPLSVIGVPTSAAAFAPGQDRAPIVLRENGLVTAIESAGVTVTDTGDCEPWAWRPDRKGRKAQNLAKVVEIVGDTARRVEECARRGPATLVLGGDCTVGIGTVAGHVAAGGSLGLVYFDAHADLNVPGSVSEGTLDWMGLAHMLGEPGARDELVKAGPRTPLLDPEQVVVFGWDRAQSTETERAALERRRVRTVSTPDVAADPESAAESTRRLFEDRFDRYLVHFDVDVIDFTEMPLSENAGQNKGLGYQPAMRALRTLVSSPRFAGLTLTELNPAHAAADPAGLASFITELASCLSDGLAHA